MFAPADLILKKNSFVSYIPHFGFQIYYFCSYRFLLFNENILIKYDFVPNKFDNKLILG